jgi:CRISPR-associated protein Csb1
MELCDSAQCLNGIFEHLFTRSSLDKAAAIKLYNDALAAIQKAKLPIHLEEITLAPSADLVTLVKKSMEIAAVEAGEGD